MMIKFYTLSKKSFFAKLVKNLISFHSYLRSLGLTTVIIVNFGRNEFEIK